LPAMLPVPHEPVLGSPNQISFITIIFLSITRSSWAVKIPERQTGNRRRVDLQVVRCSSTLL